MAWNVASDISQKLNSGVSWMATTEISLLNGVSSTGTWMEYIHTMPVVSSQPAPACTCKSLNSSCIVTLIFNYFKRNEYKKNSVPISLHLQSSMRIQFSVKSSINVSTRPIAKLISNGQSRIINFTEINAENTKWRMETAFWQITCW